MADIENNGGNWIKLNRKIWDNFIWSFEAPQYAMAWIDMLLLANYKEKKILFDGKVKVIPRGSFITSISKLSERWNMNKRTVKRFLEMLRDDGMITFQCTNKCTAVFISNYNAFQDFDDPDCTAECTAEYTAECTSDCTAECTQHKKVKNIKESKEGKEDIGEPAPDTSTTKKKKAKNKSFIPPTLEEITDYCKSRNNDVDPKKFFDYFNASDWVDSKGKPVLNWKQKVITWEGTRKENKNGQTSSDSGQIQRVGKYI